MNREAEALSASDWSKYNPWRAPGSAPVYDPCGRASGGPHATSGHGEFTNTTHNKIGDLGSKLPKMPTGVRCVQFFSLRLSTSDRSLLYS